MFLAVGERNLSTISLLVWFRIFQAVDLVSKSQLPCIEDTNLFVGDCDIAVEFRFDRGNIFWSRRKLRVGTTKQSNTKRQRKEGWHYDSVSSAVEDNNGSRSEVKNMWKKVKDIDHPGGCAQGRICMFEAERRPQA